MQQTSELYNTILAENLHRVETNVTIGASTGLLTDEDGLRITFGTTRIYVDNGSGGSGYGENMLISVSTHTATFPEGAPSVGNAISSEIELKMIKPAGQIERMARISPWIRLVGASGTSEWIQKGTFYIDTREYSSDSQGNEYMVVHGYDAMLKTEDDFPLDAPPFDATGYATDIDTVSFIANHIGIAVDDRTVELLNLGYTLPRPTGYTMREVLQYIAAMYAGNFVISDAAIIGEDGKYIEQLRFIPLRCIENETNILIDGGDGSFLMFGTESASSAEEVVILV